MNLDTLKSAWRADVSAQPATRELDCMRKVAAARVRRYEHEARLRAIFGTTAFVLTLAMLVILGLVPGAWLGMRVAFALWAASLVACMTGLWRVRAQCHVEVGSSLARYLHASLQRIHHEIAYQRALRWLFWVPFGLGLVSALAWRTPLAPAQLAIALPVVAIFWIWGFTTGPRHWPRRLEGESRQLRSLLEDLDAADAKNKDHA